MTGNITRAIVLVAYGNAFLRGNFDISGLTLEHPVFSGENKVDFRSAKKDSLGEWKERVLAGSVISWIAWQKEQEVKRLFLDHATDNRMGPDHELVAFVGGGGYWIVNAVKGNAIDHWVSRERATKEKDPKQRRLEVNYYLADQLPTSGVNPLNLNEAWSHLRTALAAICELSEQRQPFWWGKHFKPALDILGDAPFNFDAEYVAKAIPKDYYPEKPQRLLTAVSKAWVFGGMGSWNDIWWDDKELEERNAMLSADLFSAMNDAIVAAVNDPWL